jgi:hypothetical protein
MKRFALGLWVVLALAALLRPATADVFVLASGGHVDGELANPDEKPRQTYVVKLTTGGQISLQADQVVEVKAVRPDVEEYEKIRSDYPDTVEGQSSLAQWCKEHSLPTQRKAHLRRIIELDPDHAVARMLLGYKKIDGQWMTEEEWRKKEGYVKYKNEWKLPQEVKILEEKRAQELAENEWFQKIKRWRGWLGTDRSRQARENIAGIDDPKAIRALVDKLGLNKADKHGLDSSQEARLLYVDALGRIHTPEAASVLAACSVEDDDREVRLTSLEQLESMKSPKIVAYYVSKLSDKKSSNAMVNRAAIGLSRMKAASSVGPLIEALVTQHKQLVGSGGGGGGMPMSMSFPTGGTKGGIGMGMGGGGGGPKMVLYTVQNQSVLDALVVITGQNFSFDQRAWRTWYASQNKPQPIDARRS